MSGHRLCDQNQSRQKIAERLGKDGFDAKAFHGQMEVNTKVKLIG